MSLWTLGVFGKLWTPGPFGAASIVDDFKARVIANGGTISVDTLDAVAEFVASMQASGVWPLLNRVNLYCGDQLAACAVPLKIGGGAPIDSMVNFDDADYAEDVGLTGDGATKYSDTGLVPSANMVLNDTHQSIYICDALATASNLFGVNGGSTGPELSANMPYADGLFYDSQYDNAAGRVGAVVAGPFSLLTGARRLDGNHRIYQKGTLLASSAMESSETLPDDSYYMFVGNSNSAPLAGSFSNHTVAGYSLGNGLTDQNVSDAYIAWQTFQTALGRAVGAVPASYWRIFDMTSTRGDIVEIGSVRMAIADGTPFDPIAITGTAPSVGNLADLNNGNGSAGCRWPSGTGNNEVTLQYADAVLPSNVQLWDNGANLDRFPDVAYSIAFSTDGTTFTTLGTYTGNTPPLSGAMFTKDL